jgi:internalin A
MAESKYKFDEPKAAFAGAEKTTGDKSDFVGGTNGTLLIVEDEERLREVARLIFMERYQLLIAPDGLTAIHLAENHRIDVAVIDLVLGPLGQMDGVEVLKRLKFIDQTIEAIVVTGSVSGELAAKQAGAFDYFLKPYNVAELRAAVAKAMLRRQIALESQRQGPHPLNEAKLILLGRGEVGKTCLVNRVAHDKFKSTKITRGIAITQWPVAIGKDSVRLHVWDFGGQEIQHATHQFFLTERSLYLVVLNGRAGAEDEDAEYWLKFVKTFGASSPTIVVLNKFKVQPFQVNRRALQEKYPFIRAFVETDCKPKTKNGIPELKREIESALAAMEHVRADFPAGWFQIKERLAAMKEPFISFAEYRKICEGLGESDAQAQDRLAGFLNALGIALNFREDPQLGGETVLNPHWITEGVYQIITNQTLAERRGELRLADLARILPKKAYPVRMHGFLIELMRKFELCFWYHDDPAEQRYLVPELLGKEEPALKEPFPSGECLNFRYDYRLMPEGLLPRFITRTHTMSEPSERWRTGVVLRWEDCRALVKADKQERQVLVRLLGEPEKRRRLLGVIRENFDRIHAEMKEFKPTEWVALDGHPEEWIDREELEVFEQQKETKFRKRVGKAVVSVNVAKVLNETDVPGVRARTQLGTGDEGRLKLFISYAREDERWRNKLEPNLGLLRREGLIDYWHDRHLVPSSEWEEEIKRRLQEAEIILFLLSADMLNSDFIQRVEFPMAMELHKTNQARVVPVVVRRCGWERHFGRIQALPRGGRPIKEWPDMDRACFDVEEGLRSTIAEARQMLGGR